MVYAATAGVAQEPSSSAQGVRRLAAGRVTRPSDAGSPTPVARQWVVLHRVGSDRAAPLDSTRSGSDGRYRFQYRTSGSPDALYFVSSTYGGIAYFSPPLRADTVNGEDADVMVYETTTDTTILRVQGRHYVLSSPVAMGGGSRRNVAEIFEIENEGARTVIARDSLTPLWTTPLPAAAESVSVAQGDISAGAVVFRAGRAEVFAPISPGVRQLVLTYSLPVDAFPVSAPLGRKISVLEVLLEEPRASVEGARLAEVAPATIEGRTFRRFLAQDAPASAVMRISAPAPVGRNRSAMRVLAIVMAFAMLGAFGLWAVQRRRLAPALPRREAATETDRLVAELASLDARFEREPGDTEEMRVAYEHQRAELKGRIARALAGEQKPA